MDVTLPVCQVVSSSPSCPSTSALCAFSQWKLIVHLTDGINGTGIESVSVRKGNGTLSTKTVVGAGTQNVTEATYRASCCSPNVRLVAVDRVGNVRSCVGWARSSTTAAPVSTAATSRAGLSGSVSHCLWVSVAVFFFTNVKSID